MKRREFITFLGGAALACPLAARAQQPGKVYRIGYISSGDVRPYISAFHDALRALGWIEGKNVIFEGRYAENRLDRLPELVTELLRLNVDVIVTAGTLATLAAKQGSATIPIVMASAGDPVGSGLVASLARPGGNVTGLSLMVPELAGKRLELLNPATAPYFDVYLNPFKAAAASLGLEGFPAPVHEEPEFETIFAAQARTPNSGLVLIPDGFLNVHRVKITLLAAQYHLPAV
jgi:putative tryptophan/tyrosine transport system substrate-binding protein